MRCLNTTISLFSLLQVWRKYRIYLPDERPPWIVPEDVIHFIAGGRWKNPKKYEDLIKKEGGKIELKSEVELNSEYDWWSYLQIKDLFVKDRKKYGFREQLSELETILLDDPNKIISKISKYFIKNVYSRRARKRTDD